MAVKLLKKSDIILGYLAQFLNLGVGIIVLPVALRTLNSTDLNFWLILNYVYTFSALLESSFSPNVSRNITFVLSGVKELMAWGFKEESRGKNDGTVNWGLYHSLLRSVNFIYFFLAFFLLIILSVLGSVLVLSKPEVFAYKNLWYLYIAVISIGVFLGKFAAVTTGWGRVDVNNKALIYSKIVYIALSFLSLSVGFGITGLVLSFVAQSLIARFVPWVAYRSINPIHKKEKPSSRGTLEVILPNSIRTLLVALSGFTITRGIVFIANSNLPAEEVAPFTLSHQIVMVLCSVALVFVQLSHPQIAKYSSDRNKEKMIHNLVVSLKVMVGFMFLGAMIVYFFGSDILSLIGSKTPLAETGILLALLIIGFLETNHSLFASFIMAKNEVPFVVPALISALCIVVGGYWAIYYYKSILLALFCQFVVQAAFNNWYWPKVYLKSLNLNIKYFLKLVFKVR